MHFTTILASAIALAMGASAMPAPPADTRYAQLRLFGEPGCSAQNEGELGVYGDYVNKCNTFPGDTPYRSVSFEYAINNCSLRVYSDVTCHLDAHDVPVQTCLSGDKVYRSYEVHCDHL
ncbi:hypothetical protein N7509_006843 [Penicillium cosmopolitanum]|uniref:Uncharacterized protein n=1 Tax=Penicillium cosmopolitanum TaxID=1131564 RepID=A0A9W9VXP6_9EURO|nr:uncharacterized protein N7509_006843 [Penicillium cosmopolitanum]KAJ5391353.1 hypothetical protein N7509_006843 [Penicillium cosmopolitanum]